TVLEKNLNCLIRAFAASTTHLIFVPYNLGFNHISRREIIDQHTSAIASQLMCGDEADKVIVVADSTYIFIQKSRNNNFQRKTYSLHKKRSLLKPMIVVSTTGYIIDCIGPFFSDFSNNDASIMKNILFRNTNKIIDWLNQDDVVVVDRGFRDSVDIMEGLGLKVALPPFLNGRRQFTTTEANQSRYVTKIRWVVEAANARIKQFKFFSNTVQNSSLPHLEEYLSIFLEKNNLKKLTSKWEIINHTNILDEFPILSENDIVNNITLGVFQLKRARSYAEEKTSTTDLTGPVDYTMYRCKEFPDIIRIPTRSAHVNRLTHNPIIQFTSNDILEWWCDCSTGNGMLGCCSHIASAIWFLSFERWQSHNRQMPSGDFINLATDASLLSDFYDSTDDEDGTN
ncbi:unnamed protein product, partial [Rotaria sp. Silwood2]